MRLIIAMAAIAAGALPARAQRDSGTVVFVCEHGTAKSVLALAHFHRLAAERGLAFRAISRGTAPDAALPAFMTAGLGQDGFDFSGFVPMPFSEADLKDAVWVVSFDQPAVAQAVGSRVPVTAWNGLPSVTADYGTASAAIRQRVAALVASLAAGRPTKKTKGPHPGR